MMWHPLLLLDQNITLYWNVLGVCGGCYSRAQLQKCIAFAATNTTYTRINLLYSYLHLLETRSHSFLIIELCFGKPDPADARIT